MHGMVANATALALYEGEDTYNFAAALGEHIVCGTLENADQFKNGEPVKAVVSQRGDIFYVHAIMHAKSGQFYMPLCVFAGKDAIFKSCMHAAFWGGTFVSIAFAAICYFSGIYDGKYENISRSEQLLITVFFTVAAFLFSFVMEIWTYHTVKETGVYAEAIFEVFGFPQPNKINLHNVGSMNIEKIGWRFSWQADLMLKKLCTK